MICNIVKKGIGISSVLFACAMTTPSLATTTVEVPVINRSIDRGEILSREDLALKTMEINRLPRGAILKIEELVGYEILRKLRPGTPIKSEQVRTPPTTRRGKKVTILFNLPGISLRASGEALEDGHMGQRIRVINKASKKAIIAEVVGQDTVTVRN